MEEPDRHALRERLDQEALVPDRDEHAGALRERRHDPAREAENGGLVRRAVADRDCAAVLGQPVEDAAERSAEPLGVLHDKLRIGLAERLEPAASGRLVGRAPALLDLRPQAKLDDDAARHLLAERSEEAGERLRRPLGARRGRDVIAAAQARPELKRRRHARGCEDVTIGVRVAPELDLPAHAADANSRDTCATIGPMPTIDGYGFGHVTIDGCEETRDVIVLPQRVVRGWWRKDGHGLVLEDLSDVLDELPGRLVVGTGAHGRMRPDPGTLEMLRARGVDVEVLPTAEAVTRYAELDPQTTAAALHLTC
jgi:hypothetical protein